MENAISLQVLFKELPQLSAPMLTGMGARASKAFKEVTYDFPADTTVAGAGYATFGTHKVKFDFVKHPIPDKYRATIVDHIHTSADIAGLVEDHAAYIELSYEGEETDPIAKYCILTALGSMLSTQDALVLANCNSHCALNAAKLLCMFAGKDWMESIQQLPLVYLFCGAAAYDVPNDDSKVWLRTHGNHMLNIPDIGAEFDVSQHEELVPQALETFETLMGYMNALGVPIAPGHTVEGSTMMITVKEKPTATGEIYDAPSGLLTLAFSPKPVSTSI
jgi:hypothetical protein